MMRHLSSRYATAVLAAAAVAFTCAFTPARAAGDEDGPKEIMARVGKTLGKLKTLSCSFEQQYVWKAVDRVRTIEGTISMKEPYMIRVEYPGQTIVVDGETSWVYISRTNQVQISDFDPRDETFPTPHRIFSAYARRGGAGLLGEEVVNGAVCDVLGFPSEDGEETAAKVWVDRKLDFPVKSREALPSGDVVTYLLKGVVLNGRIGDDVFTFDIPDDAIVTDMRE